MIDDFTLVATWEHLYKAASLFLEGAGTESIQDRLYNASTELHFIRAAEIPEQLQEQVPFINGVHKRKDIPNMSDEEANRLGQQIISACNTMKKLLPKD